MILNRLQKILIFTFTILQILDLLSTLYAFGLSRNIYEVNRLFAFVNDRTLSAYTFFVFIKASVIYWLFIGFLRVSKKIDRLLKYREYLELILNCGTMFGISLTGFVVINNISVILRMI